MNKYKGINESDLEALLDNIIKKIFPTFNRIEVTHQVNFTIRLGHNKHEVKADGLKKYGRADILLHYKEANLAIIELKRPDIELTSEDKEQGMSYARLLTPIPPIVILSNGETTNFYKTYNGEKITKTTIDETMLQNLMETAFEASIQDYNNAIKFLLGKEEVLSQVMKKFSQKNLKDKVGQLDKLECSICENFMIPRDEIIARILNSCMENEVVTVTGDAMTGKTCIAYQLCKYSNERMIPVYIDAYGCNYNIFQQLANFFTREYFHQIHIDDVRQWLIDSFRSKGDIRFVFIVDHMNTDRQEDWKDVLELIDLNEENHYSVLLFLNNTIYKSMERRKGSIDVTVIGNSKKIELSLLSEKELDEARQIVKRDYKVIFLNGVQYNKEFRKPYILRMYAAYYNRLIELSGKDCYADCPGVLSREIVMKIGNVYLESEEMHECILSYTQALYHQIKKTVKKNRINNILFSSSAAIKDNTYEKYVKKKFRKILLNYGMVRKYIYENEIYIVPSVLEPFVVALVSLIINEIREKVCLNIDDYNEFIDLMKYMPYSSILMAELVHRLFYINREQCNIIFQELVRDKPLVKKADNFHGALICGMKNKLHRVEIENCNDGELMSNLMPWNAIAYLFDTVNWKESDFYFMQNALLSIGNFDRVFVLPPSVFEMGSGFIKYSVHTRQDGSGFLCGKMGILEPVTYAIYRLINRYPDFMVDTCERALQEQKLNFIYRVSIACNEIIGSDREEVNEAVRKLKKICEIKVIDWIC